jgi:hypothetical protein
MGTRTLIVVPLAVMSLTACSSPGHPSAGAGVPQATDEEISRGERIALPVAEPFPRLGLQWTYAASINGFGKDFSCPPRVAFRLTAQNEAGHPWAGWWLKGKGRPMEFTGATIAKDRVFFHPPRLFPFEGEVAVTYLQVAPWPVARPGKPGKTTTRLVMDANWRAVTGEKEVVKTYEDVGVRAIEVPAGRFDAWYVEGVSPGWKGGFWWVDQVGWARMLFTAEDGRTVDLRLAEVRWVDPESAGR